jgi:hypothetical protein
MREFETDFEFKDSRDYVHSTTMLEKLSQLIEENWRPREKWKLPKVDAKFLQLIHGNGKFHIQEERFGRGTKKKIMAEFKWSDESLRLFAVFAEEADRPVGRRIETNPQIDDIRLGKDYCGVCSIGCGDRISYVENVIEANKRIHLLTLNRKEKLQVLNGYMKGFPIQATYEAGDKTRIEIENVGARPREGGVVTLNTIGFPEWGNERFEISYIVEGVRETVGSKS